MLDDDGHGIEDIAIRATVTKKGDSLVVDLTESRDQVIGFVNSSYPNTISAVHMALAYLIDPRTPKNEGTFRPVTVKARQGSVVWPYPPAPVTLATNHCAQEIAEAVIKALAKSCPERVLAGWSRRFRIAISGVNPRTQAPVHLAPLPRAGRRRRLRRPATAGRPRARVRRRAASSSGAWRWRRRASRSSSRATSSVPILPATGAIAAASGRCSR